MTAGLAPVEQVACSSFSCLRHLTLEQEGPSLHAGLGVVTVMKGMAMSPPGAVVMTRGSMEGMHTNQERTNMVQQIRETNGDSAGLPSGIDGISGTLE